MLRSVFSFSSTVSSALFYAAPLYVSALCVSALLACESSPAEPRPQTTAQPAQQVSPSTDKLANSGPKDAPTPGQTGGDPVGGKFTLKDATEGLPDKGKLTATIATSLGKLECELYDDRAPTTVANFVGLARGLRPFKDKGEWVKRPAYDGTTFHRIIKGFMIQGGDPDGTGRGEPGYVIPDEMWKGAKHDQRGLLCMANRGPNTNGMQFFITDAAAPHLDQSYTIFGKCGPDSVIEALASVKTHGSSAVPGQRPDQPVTAPQIQSVTVQRK